MSGTVFIVVLAAAMLHAAWNAVVKGGSDKALNMGAVTLWYIPFASLAFFPMPNWGSLPHLAMRFALGGIGNGARAILLRFAML